jgi:hypothetical protein
MADPELGDLREREQLCRKREVDVAGRESALEASWQATEQTKAEVRREYRDPNIMAGRIGATRWRSSSSRSTIPGLTRNLPKPLTQSVQAMRRSKSSAAVTALSRAAQF